MGIEVTSVSKNEQKLYSTSAANHVVTTENIRLRGATSTTKALKMFPGLGALTRSSYEISSKLLVLANTEKNHHV